MSTVLVCLVIVTTGRRRRRPLEPTDVPVDVQSPWHAPRATLRMNVVIALVAIILAWLAVGDRALVPSLVLAITITSLRRPTLWTLAGWLMTTASFALVIAIFVARAPAPGFGWPGAFERAHPFAVLGVVLIAVGNAARSRRSTAPS